MQRKCRHLIICLLNLLIPSINACNPIFKPIDDKCKNKDLIFAHPEGPEIQTFQDKIILPTTYPIERLSEPKPAFKSLKHNIVVAVAAIELCNNATIVQTKFNHPLRNKSEFPRNNPLIVEVPHPCKESGIIFHSIEYPSLNRAMKQSALNLLYEIPVSMENCDWITVTYYNPIDGIIAPKQINQYTPKTTKDFGFPCSTKVLTKNGLRTIDQCYPGTRLICFDFESQEWLSSLVINIKKKISKKGLIRITTNNSHHDCSSDQQVFLFDKQAWICA